MKYFKIILLVFLAIIALYLYLDYGERFFTRGYLIFPKFYCEKIKGGVWNGCPMYCFGDRYCSEGCGEPICSYKKDDKSSAPLAQKADHYCFNTKMGTKSYLGIPNKFCICKGETKFISDCPSKIGVLCDSGEVRCEGEIIGYRFFYRHKDTNKEFSSINDWEGFCKAIDEGREDCMANLNYTKSKITAQ